MSTVPIRMHGQLAEKMMQLSETSAGTPMGELLRRFWHPIAISADVAPGKAKKVRLLSEDLTLYRSESGNAHLVAGRCAHRLTMLHTGWIEGEAIRCMYHGWKFDGEGKCVERPAEKNCRETNIRIAAYPVQEYSGLIFAYLGKGEPPEFDLPRNTAFEREDVMLFQRKQIWPCSWLQNVENSLDAAHVSFAHVMGRVGEFGNAITTEVPDLAYQETEAGICQTATRRASSQVRISDWTFPSENHVTMPGISPEDPWIEVSNWMVPIDDTHVMRTSLYAVPLSTPESNERISAYFKDVGNYNAADYHDELFAGEYPVDPLIRLTAAQDYVVLVGQGAIADRVNEKLGSSDLGIATLRRILWRELDAMRAGTPTKAWRRLERSSQLFVKGDMVK
ncbi:Phenylpropionate dioxygenase, large terminal subunit [Collimonas sp. OK307]|uniref:Rieske 2Fe-2S domain-containing protein n=1 Tax=Collimonas sp. OK307 TaxID=1801620 RepID=UPI0008E79EEB|nr:Rieske 2Fe-2S domain-containing protein [Collimonas sp. OK307]SFI34703.1 Phenylpropionate dioxygenase, large terminal subunit [Collimonas sp. OK307]